MKKIFLSVILCLLLLLCSCSKKINEHMPVSDIMDEIRAAADLTDAQSENLKSINAAEEYGFNLEDMEEGEACYTKAPETSDRIVLIKAKSEDSVERIERALNSKLIGLTDAWKNDKREAEKISKHIMKTKGRYVILIIADNAEELEKVFDESLA